MSSIGHRFTPQEPASVKRGKTEPRLRLCPVNGCWHPPGPRHLPSIVNHRRHLDVALAVKNPVRRSLQLGAILCSIYLVASMVAGLMLGGMALHPDRKPLPQTAPVWLHSPVENVRISAGDGMLLQAWFISAPHPNGAAVVLLHGMADNREGVAGYASMFLQHGYSVLLPDSRAYGASGGSIATYGVLERGDVRRWAA